MRIFGNFKDAILWARQRLHDNGYEIRTEKWQGIEIDDRHTMLEALNLSFSCQMTEDLPTLQTQIKPNLPWADDHFNERVSRIPHNPPPSHEWWPFTEKNNLKFRSEEKFSHTYPERIWPRYYIVNHDGTVLDQMQRQGMRYRYGDFDDVVNLLHNEPYTRQAFLPIWFPEDTGAHFGGRVPCTIGYHFIRRGDYLHVVYYIRSCDIIRHFQDDIYLACRKVIWLLEELRKRDPDNWDEVKPGMYTMHITSMHCFKSDKPVLLKYNLPS